MSDIWVAESMLAITCLFCISNSIYLYIYILSQKAYTMTI